MANLQTPKKTQSIPHDLKEMYQPREARSAACGDRKMLSDETTQPEIFNIISQAVNTHLPTCRAIESPMADHSE